MDFYLGTDMPGWLSTMDVPLFVSHRRLRRYKTLPAAAVPWSLDSGGFSELSMFGEWRTTPAEYIAAIRRYSSDVGRLQWAAPQDAMCEPWMLSKAAAWLGGTVAAHQRWTVDNYLELRHRAADLPIVPVLQGWAVDDYLRCIDLYAAAGVDLTAERLVGIGSVCRRQATAEIAGVVCTVAAQGIALHGFGVKTAGLARYAWALASADSMAWSFAGRYRKPCPHTGVASCAHCRTHALAWRTRAIMLANTTPGPVQLTLG